jgi:anaerobic magnesium-protoporphyrin IX monomethyl ester cyclase
VLPPLGIGYLASALDQKNISWEICDCTFYGIEHAIKTINTNKPRIVGIYSMATLGYNAKYIAKKINEQVEYLIAGGPLPSVVPETFLSEFDFCVLGEADFSFTNLVECLLKGEDFSNVSGVVYQNGNEIKRTIDIEYVQNLDLIPHPNRSGFENNKYIKYWNKNFGYAPGSLIATRGCPYSCDFCSRPISGKKFRKRSPEDIIEEIKEIHKLGYRHLWFADDAFTADLDFVFELCAKISNLDFNISWDCLSRVDKINNELVTAMKKSGLAKVYLGIESGSNETLNLMKKGTTIDDSKNAIQLFKNCNVDVGGFFMIGYPDESIESIWDTIEFSVREDLDYISYTVPYPLPGSPLYDRFKTYIDPSIEWSKERENKVFIEGEIPEKVLHQWIKKAYNAHDIAKKKGIDQALRYLASVKNNENRMNQG